MTIPQQGHEPIYTPAVESRREAAIEAGGAPSSQVEHPWRASARTAVQALVAALSVLAIVVPTVIQPWLEANALGLDSGVVASLLGVCAGFSALAGLVARLMAVPAVNAFVYQYLGWLAPAPK